MFTELQIRNSKKPVMWTQLAEDKYLKETINVFNCHVECKYRNKLII